MDAARRSLSLIPVHFTFHHQFSTSFRFPFPGFNFSSLLLWATGSGSEIAYCRNLDLSTLLCISHRISSFLATPFLTLYKSDLLLLFPSFLLLIYMPLRHTWQLETKLHPPCLCFTSALHSSCRVAASMLSSIALYSTEVHDIKLWYRKCFYQKTIGQLRGTGLTPSCTAYEESPPDG